MANLKLSILLLFFLPCFSCKKELAEPSIPVSEFQIEPGFKITCIASEPLIDSPVAIDFDERGRIWVVEMRGYMPNAEALGEDQPVGRISILEDRDEDGNMDTRIIFLDSLVMPRAIALVEGGLLYCEPPNLFFVKIEKDRPSNKLLIDSDYAPGLNPEYMANGLLKHSDGWIYSAGAEKKYRFSKGQWEIAPTERRGQWGICQDEMGRLFYNNNAVLLMGDYLPTQFPSTKHSINRVLSEDQRIWPSHPTLVNRGYKPGELDSLGRVTKATSACGPLIYLGNSFPEGYKGNAFVCAPEGNLIKRLLLEENEEGWVIASHAKEGVEFLASNDATFRPVNLKTGPDGDLYVVDMRRGLIQHQAYLSPYLKQASKEKGLDKAIGMGRIYKISYTGKKEAKNPRLKKEAALPILEFVNWDSTKAPVEKIKLRFQHWLGSPERTVFEKRQAVAVYSQLRFLNKNEQIEGAINLLQILHADTISSELLLYSFINDQKILTEYVKSKKIYSPYLLSSLSGHDAKAKVEAAGKLFANTDDRTAGLYLYRTYCAGCHGSDGTGNTNLAPPLVGSEVVNGTKEKLKGVIWNGKDSPVLVNGRLLKFAEPMAAFKENPAWNKEMLEAVAAYVRNAFAETE